ncbi:MAG: O-antigen ligase family protein [Oscillospiraceae bacterium]|nr:O-antigen ligase family protein [Oscillospiraceae bacterium]
MNWNDGKNFQCCDARERITDLYLITMLLVFPLFFGFSGYRNITFSKYVFLLGATGLWGALLAADGLRRAICDRKALRRASAAQTAAMAFLGVSALSALCSPWRMESFLGTGRYDGLLTTTAYVLIFLGVSRYARLKTVHIAAFAAGVTLCCAVGVLQIYDWNPLGLFPGMLRYSDAGVRYSAAFLGTIGNTNLLDAVLCVALPLFFGLYICCGGTWLLLPLLPGGFVELRAGGDGALTAFVCWMLAAALLLLNSPERVRRALHGAAVLLLSAAWAYEAVLPLTAGAVVLTLSLLSQQGRRIRAQTLRRTFLLLSAAAILGAAALLYFYPWEGGTAYEVQQVLHGQLADEFGSSRIRIWRACLALAVERPLLGGGPGTLALRLNIEFSRYVAETGETLHTYVDNVHNIYLGYLVNCGALGLAAYLGLLTCAGRTAARRWRTEPIPALALALLCGSIHGLFGLGLCISEPFFYLLLGLLCAGKTPAFAPTLRRPADAAEGQEIT